MGEGVSKIRTEIPSITDSFSSAVEGIYASIKSQYSHWMTVEVHGKVSLGTTRLTTITELVKQAMQGQPSLILQEGMMVR
jgi:hypothetical protein